jgi:hypothetical protein
MVLQGVGWGRGLHWSGSVQGQVVDVCKCGNEFSDFIKCGEFRDWTRTWIASQEGIFFMEFVERSVSCSWTRQQSRDVLGVAGLCDKAALIRDVIKNTYLCFYVTCIYVYVRMYVCMCMHVCLYCMRVGM